MSCLIRTRLIKALRNMISAAAAAAAAAVAAAYQNNMSSNASSYRFAELLFA